MPGVRCCTCCVVEESSRFGMKLVRYIVSKSSKSEIGTSVKGSGVGSNNTRASNSRSGGCGDSGGYSARRANMVRFRKRDGCALFCEYCGGTCIGGCEVDANNVRFMRGSSGCTGDSLKGCVDDMVEGARDSSWRAEEDENFGGDWVAPLNGLSNDIVLDLGGDWVGISASLSKDTVLGLGGDCVGNSN